MNIDDFTDHEPSYIPSKDYDRIPRVIIREYIKHIGLTAYAVYSFYCDMVHKDKGYAYPTYKQTSEALNIVPQTVYRINAILKKFELIYIHTGTGRAHNRYYLLKPNIKSLQRILNSKNQPQS